MLEPYPIFLVWVLWVFRYYLSTRGPIFITYIKIPVKEVPIFLSIPGKKKSSALLAQEFSICKIYVDSQTTRTLILGSASSDAGSFTVYTLLINIYILIMIHPKRGKPILNQLSLWRRGDIYHSIRLLKIWRCTGVTSRNKDIYLSHIIKDLKPSSGPPCIWTFQVLYTPSSTL